MTAAITLPRLQIDELIDENQLILPINLSVQGVSVKANALQDTGADAQLLIRRQLARKSCKKAGGRGRRVRLDQPIPIHGFDGEGRQEIRRAIVLDLTVDKRTFQDQVFLEVPDLANDAIMGRMWFEKHRVQVCPSTRSLVWPDPGFRKEPTSTEASNQDKTLPKKAKEKRVPTRHGRSWSDEARKMERNLQDQLEYPTRGRRAQERPAKPAPQQSEGALTIRMVGRRRWKRQTQEDGTWIGAITLQQVDRAIYDKMVERGEEPEVAELVQEKLPPHLADLAEFFSKKDSDKVPPLEEGRAMKIELTEPLDGKTAPLYKLTAEQLEAMRAYIADCLRRGFIEPCAVPFSSPVLFARKADGGWRMCVDYRRINAKTRKDIYPLPLIEETLDRLSSAKVFTKIDIRQAFHRLRVDPESEDLTAFRTRYGTYRYKVVPFGLTNGPALFQAYINRALGDLLDVCCTAYVDDVLIYSQNEEEHRTHVREVVKRLQKAGLQGDIKKSEFSTTEVKYLGYIITTEGVRVDPDKVAAVVDWEEPQDARGVRSFLGFCNFYRRFVRDFGRVAKPLTDLTRKDRTFGMGKAEKEAFEQLKELMTQTPLLAHYDPSRDTILETDASNGVLGAVLSQKHDDGTYHPIGFFSKKMTTTECNYPIQDKEMLAVNRAMRWWNAELLGVHRPFVVITDHEALEYFQTKTRMNARQAGWAEELAGYDYRITFRPGKENVVADALSRKTEDLRTVKERQAEARYQWLVDPAKVLAVSPVGARKAPDDALGAEATLENATKEGDPGSALDSLFLAERILDANRKYGEEHPNLRGTDGLVTKDGRLYVPETGPGGEQLRTTLLHATHTPKATAHPGKAKTRKLLKQQYYWVGLHRDVERYVGNCQSCRRNKVPRDKTPGLLKPLPIPERPWEHITADGKDMPKSRSGFDYIWVFVCRLTKTAFSIPGHKTDGAADVARKYYQRIFPFLGTPCRFAMG